MHKTCKCFEKSTLMRETIACMKQLEYALKCTIYWKQLIFNKNELIVYHQKLNFLLLLVIVNWFLGEIQSLAFSIMKVAKKSPNVYFANHSKDTLIYILRISSYFFLLDIFHFKSSLSFFWTLHLILYIKRLLLHLFGTWLGLNWIC